MGYDPKRYRSKNVYLPNDLCLLAEQKASSQFMAFSVYIRHLIVEDLKNDPPITRIQV